jgi:hypothetical protein
VHDTITGALSPPNANAEFEDAPAPPETALAVIIALLTVQEVPSNASVQLEFIGVKPPNANAEF